MTSSSQAITATARNSSPLARCIVLIETWPVAVSTCSSRTLKGSPCFLAAACARSSWACGPNEEAEFVRQHAGFRTAPRASADGL